MRPEDYQLVARTADQLGFDSMSIPEHIVMPTEMLDLMGPYWSHAMTVMSFIAGATSRIVVDSSVIVLPYHQPVVLAKAVSTLDVLSGGRVRLSVGVGHAEREFEILGVPFAERGAVTDEYLAAMIELWTSEEPAYHGRFVDFERVAFEPKPVQQPHPQIWIGGNSKAAMRRAVRHDGWFPWLITAEQLPACLDYIHSLPEFGERERPFDVVMGVSTIEVDEHHHPLNDDKGRPRTMGKQETVDAVGRLQELGVTSTGLPGSGAQSLDEHIEGLHWIAEEVMPAFR